MRSRKMGRGKKEEGKRGEERGREGRWKRKNEEQEEREEAKQGSVTTSATHHNVGLCLCKNAHRYTFSSLGHRGSPE